MVAVSLLVCSVGYKLGAALQLMCLVVAVCTRSMDDITYWWGHHGERARRNGSSARFMFSCHLAVFISPSSIELLRSRQSALLVFSQWRRDDSEKERKKQREKSPEVRLCFPLLCSRSFLRWIWEKTREASPPYTPPLSPSILSHRFIHTFVLFPSFSQGYVCAHEHERRRPKVKSALLIAASGLVELQSKAVQEENYTLSF